MATTSKPGRAGGLAALVLGLVALAGCSSGPTTGEVTGTVTVDPGGVPAEGSSINFIPTDGKANTAGAQIINGKYTATVPVGTAKVEIRIPRPQGKGNKSKPAAHKEGPGSGPSVGNIIEESLPPEYNDKTTLTFDVKPGTQEKNWDTKAMKK